MAFETFEVMRRKTTQERMANKMADMVGKRSVESARMEV